MNRFLCCYMVCFLLCFWFVSLVVSWPVICCSVLIFLFRSVLFCSVLFCSVLFCSVLFCSVLFCSVLFCSVLFCSVLFCSVLFCSVLFCSVLFCSVLFCSVLFCSVLFCSVLFCSVLFESVLYFSALFWSVLFCSVLFWSVLFCSVLFFFVLFWSDLFCSALFFSALFCSVVPKYHVFVEPKDNVLHCFRLSILYSCYSASQCFLYYYGVPFHLTFSLIDIILITNACSVTPTTLRPIPGQHPADVDLALILHSPNVTRICFTVQDAAPHFSERVAWRAPVPDGQGWHDPGGQGGGHPRHVQGGLHPAHTHARLVHRRTQKLWRGGAKRQRRPILQGLHTEGESSLAGCQG